ncbi:3D domain-containing protein [Alkaliphilus transvaalensis]|uniref:3D domain-containing protein n=1 Tax=Alkaliphilus transvaalensis TaxID=114628 RepID=UPI00068690E9|nr:3D domain-containing protein [Alkaliphilus transvaalensis]
MDSNLSNKVTLKGKILIAVITLMFLISGITYMSLQKTVVIAYDGQEVEVKTLSNTVEAILKRQGIELEPEDKITPGLQDKITDGSRITVHRSFEIQLVDSGEERIIKTAESKVEDLLNSLEIQLEEQDMIQPALDTPLRKGEVITITRVMEEFLVEEHVIPFQSVIKYNDSLDYGTTKTVQEGKSGLKEVKFKLIYEDGIEVAREVVDEIIHENAANEIIEKGTLNFVVTSRGETARYRKAITMSASAYDAGYESTGKRPGDPYYGVTASGTQVRPGVVAVDPRVIPLGTKLYIESLDGMPSYGYAVAEDTGGAIRGNKIDLYFENRSDALRFGRRNVKVYILE